MLSISNKTKQKLPAKPGIFELIHNEVCGKNFETSLTIVGEKTAKNLNLKHRQKSYVPNVLSFPLEKNSGEIFLNLNKAKKEAADQKINFRDWTLFLFLHSLLHLKGFDHGEKMEKLEKKFIKKFDLSPDLLL